MHLKAFEKLGINITKNYGNIECFCDKIIGEKIDFDFPSVGATENAILASCMAEGITEINNAAREPEIVDLQNFLNRMGAKIKGAGSSNIIIEGVKKLKDVSYNIMADRIEAGTFLCLGAINRTNLLIKNVNVEYIMPAIDKLQEMGCNFKIEKNQIEIKTPKKINGVNIKTMPYPGFPTDMQSIFATVLTTAKGTSIITENIFESRFKYMQELNRMGAKIVTEGRTAIIKGTKKLFGTNVKATDLRGGAALVLAGTVAKGVTSIENIEYILRGYEKFETKLQNIGVNIEKVI